MATGRQDSHRIALRPREYQRKQGGYEYRWRIVYVDAQQDIARDVDEKSLSALRKAGVLPAGDISDT